jgi:hypothetical protein
MLVLWLVFLLFTDFILLILCFLYSYIRDYASPVAMRIEAGLSQEKKQYRRNVKVQQIIGASAKANVANCQRATNKKRESRKLMEEAQRGGIPYSEAIQRMYSYK